MTETENHTIKLIQQMRDETNRRFDRIEHTTETILKEVRFLRNNVFNSEDESHYWRNTVADLQNEVKALIARLERIEGNGQ